MMKPPTQITIKGLEGFDREALEESLDLLKKKAEETRAERRLRWKEMVIQTAGVTATRDRLM